MVHYIFSVKSELRMNDSLLQDRLHNTHHPGSSGLQAHLSAILKSGTAKKGNKGHKSFWLILFTRMTSFIFCLFVCFVSFWEYFSGKYKLA